MRTERSVSRVADVTGRDGSRATQLRVTEPPVSGPRVVEPPVAEPPVAEPPVAEPPVVEPPAAEPSVVEPPVAGPRVVEPPVAESPASASSSAARSIVHIAATAEPPGQSGVGVVAPFDFALDRELWRWTPDDVSLYVTRLPFVPVPVTVEMATALSDDERVARATRDLLAPGPLVVAYACASGSFVNGREGQRRLHDRILSAGEPAAVTTSGALVDALDILRARRVAVVTPYVDSVTERLLSYLADHQVTTVASLGLGLLNHIWKVTYAEVAEAVREVDRPDAEAVFVSCTNVLTYDVIEPLERLLGKPVLTANQVTMWAALRSIGREPVAPGQWLIRATSRQVA